MATGYLSLVLTPQSAKVLAKTYATLEKIVCHHMTIVFGTHELEALPETLKGAQPGDSFTLRVFGIARSATIEAAAVGLVRDGKIVIAGISNNTIPHITISLVPGKAKPVESNDLLEEGFFLVADGPELEAELKVTKFDRS